METQADGQIRARDYVKSVLVVALGGVLVEFLAFFLGPMLVFVPVYLLESAGYEFGPDVCYSPAYVSLIVACMWCGFIQGHHLGRELSVIAVPVGWLLIGAAISPILALGVPSAGDMILFMILLPALASPSARRGHLYSLDKSFVHVAWLVVLSLAFTLVLILNRQLFGLVPDQLRWRIWHCPL